MFLYDVEISSFQIDLLRVEFCGFGSFCKLFSRQDLGSIILNKTLCGPQNTLIQMYNHLTVAILKNYFVMIPLKPKSIVYDIFMYGTFKMHASISL